MNSDQGGKVDRRGDRDPEGALSHLGQLSRSGVPGSRNGLCKGLEDWTE